MSNINKIVKKTCILDDGEQLIYSDNYMMPKIRYDTDHGKSIYSDENIKRGLNYDSSEDESVQELKKKVIEKRNKLYY